MLSAVRPPYLLKVVRQMFTKLAFGGKLVVDACFLKTTMSNGVNSAAIVKLDARQESKMLTN